MPTHPSDLPVLRRVPQLALAVTLGAFLTTSSMASDLDLDAWARILDRHTRAVPDIAGVRVDYAALAGPAAAEWLAVVRSLERSDPAALETPAERMAFWINAYNILAIDVVLSRYPVESIRDVGSLFTPVWKQPAGRIAGKGVTLDRIEHEILRPMGDPRIHAAIVCASLSCPPLRREPYRAARLDAQLDDNARAWLADPRKGAALEAGRLQLSPILDWFEEDFEAGGGVLAFVAAHGPEAVRAALAGGRRPRVDSLDYDWRLNDTATQPGAP